MNFLLKKFNFFHRIDRIDIFVFIVLFIGCLFSISQGYVNADSWLYLHLAQSISMGKGLTLNEGYFAIFPFGYPLLIAIFSFFSTNITTIIIGSKILNFTLAIISYTFAKKLFKNKILAMFFIINPIYLTAFAWTISENLFYTSILGVFYYAIKLHEEKNITNAIKLFLCLLAGISARYFAGTFFFTFFIIYIITFGKKDFFYKLTPFATSGIIFIAYQLINKELTGYSSGMPRIPAPESLKLLAYYFQKTFVNMSLTLLGCYLLIAFRKIRLKKDLLQNKIAFSIVFSAVPQQDSYQKRISLLIILSGFVYLLDHFILRSLVQYNDFGTRITGFGTLLLFIGFTFYYFKIEKSLKYISALLFSIVCFDIADLQSFKQFNINKFEHADSSKYTHYISFTTSFTPTVNSKFIHNQSRHDIYTMDRDEYYGYDKKVIFIKTGPYVIPDTLSDIRQKLDKIDISKCAIDFTKINNLEQFQSILLQSTQIDIAPERRVSNMSPDVQIKLKQIFKPNTLVPCSTLLTH